MFSLQKCALFLYLPRYSYCSYTYLGTVAVLIPTYLQLLFLYLPRYSYRSYTYLGTVTVLIPTYLPTVTVLIPRKVQLRRMKGWPSGSIELGSDPRWPKLLLLKMNFFRSTCLIAILIVWTVGWPKWVQWNSNTTFTLFYALGGQETVWSIRMADSVLIKKS